MKKLFVTLLLAMLTVAGANAQRTTDKLDRGLTVAACRTGGNLVSWKLFANEYFDVTYNLYRNGTAIAKGLEVPTYVDASGSATHKYQVAAVVNGVEQERSAEATKWPLTDGGYSYLRIPIPDTYGRDGSVQNDVYSINDMCLADVNGDGKVEFITKIVSNNAHNTSNKNTFHHIEVFDLNGNRLWWIDLGPNMISGPDEQFDAVAYDWDGDGKAEVLMRGADNMIIHQADGKINYVGSNTADLRWDGVEYISTGNEYLLYLNGETGEIYQLLYYPLPRGNDADWGSGISGHRSTKHYFGAPFLDGKHASIFLGRGAYTKHHFKAFDVDPQTHELTMLWEWGATSGVWFGNGYHNFGIADVDEDGRDEIVFGSMVIDDNGKGLHTTGLGHGDAQHCGDFDPYRKGLEMFACNESQPNMNYRNATTGEMYYRSVGTGDDGRALCGNFSNKFPGAMGRSVGTGLISCVADKEIQGGPASGGSNDALFWSHLNFRIFWDDDLLDEVLDSPGTARSPAVYDPDNGRLLTGLGHMNNSSKNNPCATGDIFGDWREEIVVPDEGYVDEHQVKRRVFYIYTTNYPNTYRIPTLWHDHQYRQAMVWQSIGYNQPPHTSFFLGELEDITHTPPPYTNDGRVLIENGGTINSRYDGKDVLVYETNDSRVKIDGGASPSVAIFNVPSWVQGTNSTNTKKAVVNTTYYTCVVSGGSFVGQTRLVKQGDGLLVLPNVAMSYSGLTQVWAGSLEFDGTLMNSKVWLNRFTALKSNGGTFQDITMKYGAALYPGNDGCGTITAKKLTLDFGAKVVFDINNLQEYDFLSLTSLELKTQNWQYGPKYNTPVFQFNLKEATSLENGTYLLAQIDDGVTGNINDILLEGLGNNKKTSLKLDGKNLYLIVEGLRDADEIVWNGNSSAVWNLAGSENFTLANNSESTNNLFVTGDKVLFNDDAKTFNVELQGELEAESVTVNSSKNYTFTGNGSLVGNTKLVKEGSGILTINNDNTYKGGTRISGGTVKVNSLSSSTQTYGNLGGVVSTNTKFIIENGATLQTTALVNMGSPIKVQSTEGGVINAQSTFNMNNPISGTLLTKKGGGNLILFANNSLTKLIIMAGTVEQRAGQAANTIELQGGTLVDGASNTSHPIIVPKGKTATWKLGSAYYLAYANKITGEGTLTINPTNTVSRVRITGDWSKFTGTIKHTNTNIWLPLDASTGLPNGTLDIASGCGVTNVCKSFTIGKLTGQGSLNHPISNFQNQTAVLGSNNWRVGNSSEELGNFTFDGIIHDDGGNNKANFEKIGTCTMTVTGAWDNTGITQITAGRLIASANSTLGKGTLTITANGTLKGNTSLTNSSYSVYGTIAPGMTDAPLKGELSFGGKNVTVYNGGNIAIYARKKATSTDPGCTTLSNIDKLTMNGMVTVNVYANNTFKEGDYIRVWTANSFEGTPTLNPESVVIDVQKGLYWDDSHLNEGLLYVTTTPPVGIATIATSAKVKAQVISTSGAVVKTLEGDYTHIVERVNDTELPAGIYIIRISDGKATETRKITIK